MTQPQPLKPFPVAIDPTPVACQAALMKIGQIRQDDQNKWQQLAGQFILGRSVTKIPANSSDTGGNVVGDFNVTSTYAYFCVNNSGTTQWVRVAVGTF